MIFVLCRNCLVKTFDTLIKTTYMLRSSDFIYLLQNLTLKCLSFFYPLLDYYCSAYTLYKIMPTELCNLHT